MQLRSIQRLELPPTADMHVHLRQAGLMDLVAPTVRQGGVDTVFVMPNLVPPLTTVKQVLEYQSQLRAIIPGVRCLMSLFLHPSVTPEVIAEAAAAGITGVKLYPQGVTTNSESGVSDLESFYATFAAMERHGLGKPYSAAVEAVRACGPTVGATITAHHLYLTSHDACCDPFAFCKPIPKKPTDRDALVRAVTGGDSKFFFGSDSAPHPLQSKTSAAPGKAPAGVFTQPFVTQLVLLALEEAIERGVITEADVTQEKLEGFLSRFARRFYQLPEPDLSGKRIVLERKGERIPKSVRSDDGAIEVGVSRAEAEVFSLRWEEAA
ncbi:amidohydrolase 2 [Ophiocordyceps sinensis CO18]|uniref:Amidohydrolase 2 n=1 Tax=Ophiocordyceps sinensis (strain Co18 / CGMCC 3.14243) TaxID=911162 RepID=T5A8C4_OPHSC|nr:amidohydrolase 2 [Ophiocordyceps sinensis CO18]